MYAKSSPSHTNTPQSNARSFPHSDAMRCARLSASVPTNYRTTTCTCSLGADFALARVQSKRNQAKVDTDYKSRARARVCVHARVLPVSSASARVAQTGPLFYYAAQHNFNVSMNTHMHTCTPARRTAPPRIMHAVLVHFCAWPNGRSLTALTHTHTCMLCIYTHVCGSSIK